MSRSSHDGPKLPAGLLESVGSGASHGNTRSRSEYYKKPLDRKEHRKAFRIEKKQQRIQTRRPYIPKGNSTKTIATRTQERPRRPQTIVPTEKPQAKEQPTITTVKPKQEKVVKKAKPESVAKPPLSRAEKAKLEDDDAEIAALERKLGLKGKKKKLFEDDDFEGLLDGLDGQVDSVNGKRKRSDYDDFLALKRRQIEASNGAEGLSASDGDEDDQDLSDGSIGENILEHDSDLEATGDDFDGFDDETGAADIANPFSDDDLISSDDFNESDVEDSKPTEKKDKQRENPYVAPLALNTQLSEKYIPPSMRKRMGNGGEDLSVLRRQMNGLLNRLSESKFANIVHEVEAVYGSNARQHVTTVVIDLLMALLCDKSPLMDTFIILHAGFAAAIYKVIGSHFGAQLLERIVTDFERLYQAELAESSGSKECTNLIALLAELYTFQLVGSNVIFDCIRVFLADLTELNTELLLKLIKNCGSQLRHDDPSSLKDIVILLHKSVAKAGEANLPVRTKFMIEIINDLKNNRVKAGAAASVVAAEQTSRLKKVLGSLANAKATEPLGVSLADIKSSSKEGKWWLVGASWKNDAQGSDTIVEGRTVENDFSDGHDKVIHGDDGSGADLLMLAKQQRMNTDIRRAIFMNIMSAEDYNDAHARLLKLKLKKAQELEIPRVLIHCAGAEDSYNPYYTLIAKQLCSEHRFKWAMQYGLWDLFKRMGEKSNGNDDFDDGIDVEGDEEIDLKRMVNLGRLYGQLVADNSLSLTSLKVLNFAYLQTKTKMFLEVLLGTAFKQLSRTSKASSSDSSVVDSAIAGMIMRAKDTPQVITGLQYFLSREADLEKIASSSSDRKLLKRASKTMMLVLTQLSTSML